ncbi:MAG TPA: 1-deoxy-D-xylulose-5-phosphate reductoisomerase [Terriglobales bacterium]|nr:1-deoxy-D-xylulose-5-phosphate reductoisomerase [Terriglobales bacterium]
MARTLAILGSTGSIGTSALDVVDRLAGRFEVTALAAGANLPLLARQVEKYRPRLVSVKRPADAEALRPLARRVRLRIVSGPEGAEEVARDGRAEIVVSAITGIDGFRPTLAAVRAGKRVALANKESVVVGGEILFREAARSGARIIPVDSEHSGVFQCLAGVAKSRVRRVVLTASGGPFFRTPLRQLSRQRLEDVLRHPTWRMGRKVTVDSATLMNKGLELIEARWLFGLEPARLDVLIHPQSVVHALVETADGSVLAQLSAADMRIPIQYALTFPERRATGLPRLDLSAVRRLEFHEVDGRRYPLFVLARLALEAGGSHPVALNAANETAVAAFLEGRLTFADIPAVVQAVMDGHHPVPAGSVEAVFAVDREARRAARHILKQR